MKYNIQYDKRCLKYLKKLSKDNQLRIIKAINELPFGDVKRLQGGNRNYRLRVGDYRIIFSKDDEKLSVLIIEIGQRGDIYYRN
ncbi:MAG: type II toxin-antitoxin system RelE/ParE family toxin [Tissierellia bacterium]|jgi:mRNA interferase RelE/StbE|nr:type II toxin-antitoxin system RelE/ParE family toxin [Tissierellia bacterium]